MSELMKDRMETAKSERKAKTAASDKVKNEGRVDAHGIPYAQPVKVPEQGVLPNHMGTMMYPLWNGTVIEDPEGVTKPKIVLCPVAENINGGQGAAFYKAKGFKEVSEIPDAYAEFRDPYLRALEDLRAKQRERDELRRKMAEAGIRVPGYNATTTKSLRGMIGE